MFKTIFYNTDGGKVVAEYEHLIYVAIGEIVWISPRSPEAKVFSVGSFRTICTKEQVIKEIFLKLPT